MWRFFRSSISSRNMIVLAPVGIDQREARLRLPREDRADQRQDRRDAGPAREGEVMWRLAGSIDV
jgi:hypothetical protein